MEKDKVRRLKKSFYGLKQSLRAGFGRFTKAMLALGYKESQEDHTLFIKHSNSEFEIKDIPSYPFQALIQIFIQPLNITYILSTLFQTLNI